MVHAAGGSVPTPMKLLIAIPALDEEESIQRTIERCLHARQGIIDGSPVTQVEITVVSDGSTDRTVELAQGFGDRINLIVFPRNRGYGAALTSGFAAAEGDFIMFMDSDRQFDIADPPGVRTSRCVQLSVASATVKASPTRGTNRRVRILTHTA